MKDVVESDTQAHTHTCRQNLPSHKYITTLTQTYTHTRQQQHAYSAKSKSTTRVAVEVGVAAAAAAASGALIYLSVFFVPRRAT